MVAHKVDALIATLTKLSLPETNQKRLFAQVCEAHPEASKTDIIRAAFRALIENVSHDPAKADRLHEMALGQRALLNHQ
jgi:hypothetical protein